MQSQYQAVLTAGRAVEGAVALSVPTGIWENDAEQGFGRFARGQPVVWLVFKTQGPVLAGSQGG